MKISDWPVRGATPAAMTFLGKLLDNGVKQLDMTRVDPLQWVFDRLKLPSILLRKNTVRCIKE